MQNNEKAKKALIADGFDRTSPFWNLMKLRFLNKSQSISYKLLRTINNILHFKRYFKRYSVIDGHRFWVKPASKMMMITNDYIVLENKIWEAETTDIVKKYVTEGMRCLDIGASVGYFTLLFSRLVGATGYVISVEPTDFQQPYLRKNIKNNGYEDRVEVWNVGAWDTTGRVKMPLNADPYVQTEAHCMAVDEIVNGRTIDFIKIDVDGPEPKVLKGLLKTFESNPHLKMVIEYYPKFIEDAGLSTQEFRDIIDKYFEFEVIPGDYSDGCWNLFCKRNDNAKNTWPVAV